MNSNPFTVSSPEMMQAGEMLKLYVPLAEDFEIEDPGHVFVHGHRGCGKSMMLRLLAPDCRCIALGKALKELPFLALYATIKSTDLDITEFERIKDQYAGVVLAEHSLSLFLASKILQSLRDHTADYLKDESIQEELRNFLKHWVLDRLHLKNPEYSQGSTDPLEQAINGIDTKYGELINYLRQLSIAGATGQYIPFEGRVVGYREFLFPLCSALTDLPFMPKGKPLYILLDDADNLNSQQTKVLNTWVSYRTGNKVSFKISTQLGYKHYRTTANQRIEAPHDFKEVNISTIYTGGTSKGSYPKWVEDIVSKRLHEHGINVDAKSFFPVAEVQERAIEKIKDTYKEKWSKDGRGYRPSDDATRYARPDYIKSLGGTSKKGSTYLYAGFDQLVHVSSGIVRYFLDSAASMYADEAKRIPNTVGVPAVNWITPATQDEVIRNCADELMFVHLERLVEEAEIENGESGSKDEYKQLRNLIQALGGIFQAILFSDRSERRVFSIALSDMPSDNVIRILKLGVKHGYLYEGAIGTKDGRWRARKYVMTRRLAPTFKLDPTGFAGYLFVTSDLLHTAITNPRKAIRDFEYDRLETIDEAQLELWLES